MSNTTEQNNETGFYKGVMFTSVGSMSNIVVLFIETVIAVRILAPEKYGIYVLMVAVANFLVMGIDFGCKIAVTQQIAGATRKDQAVIVNSVMLFRIITCLAFAALVWFGRDALMWLEPNGELLLYASWIPAMFIVTSLDQLVEAMLKGFKQYRHVAVAQVTRSLLRFGLTVLFLVPLNMGILGVVASWILSFVISFGYQYLMLPVPKRPMIKLSVLSQILRFGAPIQVTYFLWHVSGQIQVVLLSTLAGPASVAIFDVAAKIPMALQRFSESFISVYFPTMSSLLSSKQYKKAGWMLDQSLKLSSFASGIGVLVAVVFSRDIIGLLFSEQYMGAALAFAIMMVAFHMTFIVNLLGYTLTSAGYPQLSLVENSVRATVSTIGSLLLIPLFDFNGAAFSRLLSNYASNPVAIWLLHKKEISINIRSFVIQTGLLILGSVVGWYIPLWDVPLAANIALRMMVVLLFIGINLGLNTVSLREINALIPQSLLVRIGLHKQELPDSI